MMPRESASVQPRAPKLERRSCGAWSESEVKGEDIAAGRRVCRVVIATDCETALVARGGEIGLGIPVRRCPAPGVCHREGDTSILGESRQEAIAQLVVNRQCPERDVVGVLNPEVHHVLPHGPARSAVLRECGRWDVTLSSLDTVQVPERTVKGLLLSAVLIIGVRAQCKP